MFGFEVTDLMSKAKSDGHWRERMYSNTVTYLRGKFPFRLDAVLKLRLQTLKKRITRTEEEIRRLTLKLDEQRGVLRSTCPHPINKMTHSGYAASGTSHTGKYRSAIHEDVECGICGARHSFEQEATEEYQNDGF